MSEKSALGERVIFPSPYLATKIGSEVVYLDKQVFNAS